MNFLNPLLLLGALGITLPILAHLLNKHQFKQTDWAAMQFLNRAVNVRSRQIKLRDFLLLILRCLALLLLVLAIAKPILEESSGAIASKLGERRAGVVIALDASFSMQHSDGTATRFERAIEKIETIAKNIYHADGVVADSKIRDQLKLWEEQGYGRLPICMAKTQYSFTTDPSRRGAPTGHSVPVREVRLSAGAGFVVVVCGEAMTMPGLPRAPAAQTIRLNDDGEIEGLF
jgi:hypothetical protein